MRVTSSNMALFCTVFASVLLLGTPVHAQSSGASGPGDIVVTARRVEERLQDVPISITVFSQEQLSNRNVVTAADLATYTPSLSVNQRFGPEKASFAIRGFVQENATAPSVGVYFADVEYGRAQGGTASGGTAPVGSFMDLQNVQVLKGPQGTLFGRNTTGGAVLLVPAKPTDRLEGWVEGSIGNYDMLRAQAVLNIPLADTFKVRVAVDRQRRDGYMRNRSGIGPADYNDVDYFAARLSFVADLTPDLENYVIASYSHSSSNGAGARVVACNPNSQMPTFGAPPNPTASLPLVGVSPALQITARAACDQIARQNARGDGPLDVDIDNPSPFLDLTSWQVINTTTWRANDNLTVKNIASYQEFRENNSISLAGDNFFVPNPAPSLAPLGVPAPLTPGAKFQYVVINPYGPNSHAAAQSTFSEELQLQGQTSDGRLVWQTGGYVSLSRPIGFNAQRTGTLLNCTDVQSLQCSNNIFIGSVSQSQTKASFTTIGLYAQATYKLTDQLSVTGGLRYTWDKTEVLSRTTRLRLPATLQCNDTLRFPGAAPGQGRVVQNADQCLNRFPAEKSDAPTWLIDLDYKPNDDLLLYAKYARGYRQGGINPTNIGLESWQPEKVDSYEVGAKYGFRGSVSGYFNVAGFYNDFTKQQLVANAVPIPGSGFAGAQPVVNAGKSRLQGIEADASATFFDSLRIDLGYTYLDTKLISFDPPAIPAGAPYNQLFATAFVGGPLALSPKHRVTVTGTYALPLDESVGKISLGATYTHTSSQFFNRVDYQFIPFLNGGAAPFGLQPFGTANVGLTSPDLGLLPKTDLLNLNVNWDGVMGLPVDAAFFVTNVTNRKYPVGVNSISSGGFESYLYGAPRMWGFRLRYNFGE